MQEPQTEVLVRSAEGAELLRAVLTPGEYVIGRSAECALRIEGDLLSRQHARLTLNFDHALIEDLGSSNGTFINDQPVAGVTRLWAGQKIRLGSTTIELHRMKTLSGSDQSLAPHTAAVRQILPEEFLREKKYDIGGVVAQGGMGAILDAREVTIDRRVAMKVMLDTSDGEDLTRFVAEAKITAQLEHPNIVPVHELGVDENEQLFYTMKFVRGITLKKVLELLAQGVAGTIKKYPLGNLLTVFQKLCDAIAFAHAKGVIHRDLKSENVMIGDFGEVLVMDWGLAKIVAARAEAHDNTMGARSLIRVASASGSSPSSTMAGMIMGTPQYMSPEQARGEIDTLDTCTDIYSLGAILYQILALRPPVEGDDARTIVDRVSRGEIDPLPRGGSGAAGRRHLPDGRVPDSLAAVTRKAMMFDPAQRYASVPELQHEIEAYQNGFATGAERAGIGKQIVLLIRRNRRAASALAAVLLLLTGFGIYFVSSQRAMAANLARLKNTVPAFLAQAQALIEKATTQDGALDQALAQVEFAIEIAPEQAEPHAAKGRILQTLQRIPAAREAFAQALKLNPAEPSARQNLPLCDAILGEQAGKSELTMASLRRLQGALQQQWRGSEAVVLGRALGKGKEQVIAAWAPVLKKAGIDRPIDVNNDGDLLLNLDDQPVKNLAFLKGMPLGQLQIARTQVTDLSPLAGMPLRRFSCPTTEVSDLSPLRGMQLVELQLGSSKVTDLSPLRGMPLEKLNLSSLHPKDLGVLSTLQSLSWLDISNSGVSDLKALRGLKLKWLSMANSPLEDLSPLQGMPLEFLNLTGCGRIETLKGLAGLPLRNLNVRYTHVADLSPLRGLPLDDLDVAYSSVRDLRVLAGFPLRTLSISGLPITDFGPLREFKKLRALQAYAMPVRDLGPLRGLPIEELMLDRCFELRDLEPLKDLPRLVALSLPAQAKGAAALRSIASLRLLVFNRQFTPGAEVSSAIKRNAAAEPLLWFEAFDKARAAGRVHPSEVPGFVQIFPGAVQFGKSWYFLNEGNMPWSKAKEIAEAVGGHLATITSRAEHDFALATFTQKLTDTHGYWLGARADKPLGTFQWVTGEPWEFTGWNKGEPNNKPGSGGDSETCLSLWRRSASEIGWSDSWEAATNINGFLIEWDD